MYAFPEHRSFVWSRIAIGILVPVLAGLIIQKFLSHSGVGILSPKDNEHHAHDETGCACGHCEHDHDETHADSNASFVSRIARTLAHTGEEFIKVSPYIIVGAAVSASIQTALPKDVFASFGGGTGIAVQTLIMMGAAFLLSVCSTSDAFIARGFLFSFAPAPIIAFITAGPMIDIKNVLMMTPYFRKRFIVLLASLIFILVFISIMILSMTVFGGVE